MPLLLYDTDDTTFQYVDMQTQEYQIGLQSLRLKKYLRHFAEDFRNGRKVFGEFSQICCRLNIFRVNISIVKFWHFVAIIHHAQQAFQKLSNNRPNLSLKFAYVWDIFVEASYTAAEQGNFTEILTA